MNNKDWLDEIDKKIEEKRRNYKGPHCCLTMDAELSRAGTILNYSAKYREYGVKLPKSTGCMLMDYCMFCGKKLPESLRVPWHDTLEQEYRLEYPAEEDKKKVPKEFLTDEWWKKREL